MLPVPPISRGGALFLGAPEAIYAAARVAFQASGVPEMIEVRDGFPHREELLLRIQRAAEEQRKDRPGGDGRLARGRFHFGEPRGVVRAQRLDPRVDADEGQAMRR